MENLINYIKPELLIVAVLLYGLGAILKKTKLKDNFIPIILGVVGMVIGITYCSVIEGFNFSSLGVGSIQGLLCATASNYVNQVIKQMKKLGDEKADVIEEVIESLDNKS